MTESVKPAAIELQEVTSGNISHLGYDKESNTLMVKFRHGGKYSYAAVSEEAYEHLLTAPSIGKHFQAFIRTQYTGVKMVEEQNGSLSETT